MNEADTSSALDIPQFLKRDREEVIKVEAIKISYRQTKEGNVVSFRIHPNDNDRYIADMALGQNVLLGVAVIDSETNT